MTILVIVMKMTILMTTMIITDWDDEDDYFSGSFDEDGNSDEDDEDEPRNPILMKNVKSMFAACFIKASINAITECRYFRSDAHHPL
jgi:hypothetical protein